MIKKLALLSFLFVVCVAAGHIYYHLTGDFHLDYLMKAEQLDFDLHRNPHLPRELLSQPFYYLGHGHQTFAFASEDGRVVLKLFKKDYFQRSWLVNILPPTFPFRSLFLHSGRSKDYRRERLLMGYHIAYQYDKENSGLLFYHPQQAAGDRWLASLYTGIGTHHKIDLNKYVFALQVMATTTKQELSNLLSKGEIAQAKERLRQLQDLYLSSYQKGIYDLDHNILDNTGFLGTRAIRQDVGKVERDLSAVDHTFIQKDLKKIVDQRLNPWLRKHFPEWTEELSPILSSLSNEK